jgi:hypothetical protein
MNAAAAGSWNYEDTADLHGRKSATKARLEALAWVLDRAIRVPGTNFRVGLDGVLGLVPGIGDAITTALALWFVYEAHRINVPGHVIARMLGNVAIDSVVGAVPVVGDLFDFAFKANIRNLELLRRHL